MIYHLNVLSWAGIALGASHYWGVINANYRAKEDVPSIKLDNNRMFSEKEVISAARHWFKKNAKQGDILLHGSHCSCDPQTILIANLSQSLSQSLETFFILPSFQECSQQSRASARLTNALPTLLNFRGPNV